MSLHHLNLSTRGVSANTSVEYDLMNAPDDSFFAEVKKMGDESFDQRLGIGSSRQSPTKRTSRATTHDRQSQSPAAKPQKDNTLGLGIPSESTRAEASSGTRIVSGTSDVSNIWDEKGEESLLYASLRIKSKSAKGSQKKLLDALAEGKEDEEIGHDGGKEPPAASPERASHPPRILESPENKSRMDGPRTAFAVPSSVAKSPSDTRIAPAHGTSPTARFASRPTARPAAAGRGMAARSGIGASSTTPRTSMATAARPQSSALPAPMPRAATKLPASSSRERLAGSNAAGSSASPRVARSAATARTGPSLTPATPSRALATTASLETPRTRQSIASRRLSTAPIGVVGTPGRSAAGGAGASTGASRTTASRPLTSTARAAATTVAPTPIRREATQPPSARRPVGTSVATPQRREMGASRTSTYTPARQADRVLHHRAQPPPSDDAKRPITRPLQSARATTTNAAASRAPVAGTTAAAAGTTVASSPVRARPIMARKSLAATPRSGTAIAAGMAGRMGMPKSSSTSVLAGPGSAAAGRTKPTSGMPRPA